MGPRSAVGLGACCAGWAVAAILVIPRLSNPFAEPLRLPYSGETLRDVPVGITMKGAYEVALEIPRAAEETIETPTVPLLRVEVRRDGARIDRPSTGGAWSRDFVESNVGHFRAGKKETVLLSVEPGPTLKRFQRRSLRLIVRRVPMEYANHLIAQMGLEALAALYSILGLAFLRAAGKGFRRRRLALQGLGG